MTPDIPKDGKHRHSAFAVSLALLPGALVLGLKARYGQAHAMPPAWLFGFALLWGLVLLQAMEGMGFVIYRSVMGRRDNWAIHSSVGMATLVLVGGWLNWFQLANSHVLAMVLWAGVSASVVMRFLRSKGEDAATTDAAARLPRVVWVVVAALAMALIWRYTQSAAWSRFNGHDDFHAYLLFPKKLLELGWLGTDPFSERRLVSGLGGQYILLAAIGVELPERFWHLLDPGLATLMTAALVGLLPIRSGEVSANAHAATLVVILGAVLVTPDAVNVMAEYSLMPFIVTAIYLANGAVSSNEVQARREMAGSALLIGLLAGAALTLKNTFVPFVMLIALGVLALVAVQSRWHLSTFARFAVPALIAILCTTLPWMLDLHRSSGTLMYPLLGRGFHGSVYGLFPVANSGFLSPPHLGHSINSLGLTALHLLFIFQLAAVGFALSGWRNGRVPARLILLIGASAIATTFAIWWAAGGYGTYRYAAPVLLTGLVASAVLLREWATAASLPRVVLWGVAFVMGGYGWSHFEAQHRPGAAALRQALSGQDIATPEQRAAYQRLSEAIPRDGAVLTRLSKPFLLPQRVDLFIADYPGGASPPPGMPMGATTEQWVAYLRARGVRYLAWDYATEAGFSKASFGDRLDPGEHPWIRAEATATFEFHDHLEKVRGSHRVIYDGDGFAVIDLALM